jgi:hypothetical protein
VHLFVLVHFIARYMWSWVWCFRCNQNFHMRKEIRIRNRWGNINFKIIRGKRQQSKIKIFAIHAV